MTKSTTDILTDARNNLSKRGAWKKGTVGFVSEDGKVCGCALGHINYAAACSTNADRVVESDPNYVRAVNLVAAAAQGVAILDSEYPFPFYITEENDKRRTRKKDVVAWFDAAIEASRA
jgi:hypothetical protein